MLKIHYAISPFLSEVKTLEVKTGKYNMLQKVFCKQVINFCVSIYIVSKVNISSSAFRLHLFNFIHVDDNYINTLSS
jgi:hypothetical protein